MESINGNVLRLWRIQNQRLWRWYYLMKQDISKRSWSLDANEKLVWHGTDINNIDDIIKNGFDIRLARDGAIGQGIYFAASASTSLSYVKNGDKMLLCRVALGNTTGGQRNLRRPPQAKPGVLYDSVEGRIGDDTMFCLFDNYQCYPEFVIEYQILPQKEHFSHPKYPYIFQYGSVTPIQQGPVGGFPANFLQVPASVGLVPVGLKNTLIPYQKNHNNNNHNHNNNNNNINNNNNNNINNNNNNNINNNNNNNINNNNNNINNNNNNNNSNNNKSNGSNQPINPTANNYPVFNFKFQ